MISPTKTLVVEPLEPFCLCHFFVLPLPLLIPLMQHFTASTAHPSARISFLCALFGLLFYYSIILPLLLLDGSTIMKMPRNHNARRSRENPSQAIIRTKKKKNTTFERLHLQYPVKRPTEVRCSLWLILLAVYTSEQFRQANNYMRAGWAIPFIVI